MSGAVGSGWELPGSDAGSGGQWVLPPEVDDAGQLSSGPAGLVLGRTGRGPVAVRLFGPQPHRIVLALADYQRWLLLFRLAALGAHVSLITPSAYQPDPGAPDHPQPGRWRGVLEVLAGQRASVDVVDSANFLPRAGRPYRPSAVIDDAGAVHPQQQFGPWQAVLPVLDLAAEDSVLGLRAAELALVGRQSGRGAEHLRRAYALSARQTRLLGELDDAEIVLAAPRRLVRVPLTPTPTEHRLLFT